MAGGGPDNMRLRDEIQAATDLAVHLPPLALCTDNAAMIASAAYYRHAFGKPDSLDMEVEAGWALA